MRREVCEHNVLIEAECERCTLGYATDAYSSSNVHAELTALRRMNAKLLSERADYLDKQILDTIRRENAVLRGYLERIAKCNEDTPVRTYQEMERLAREALCGEIRGPKAG